MGKKHFQKAVIFFMATSYLFIYTSCDNNASSNSNLSLTNQKPEVTTTAVSNITGTSAESGGVIIDEGSSPIIVRGVCWSESPEPDTTNTHTMDGAGFGSFGSILTGLQSNTTFYVRAYAANSTGITYGNEEIFTTGPLYLSGNGVNDVDGNFYNSVILGTQEWLRENLKTTKYKDGTSITYYSDYPFQWPLLLPAYFWYNDDESYKTPYGALYNWYAVQTGNLCPNGWRVPTEDDWTILINYLGSNAGGKMKTTGTIQNGTGLWWTPNNDATNESNFSALPAGYRSEILSSMFLGDRAYWWNNANNDTTVSTYSKLVYQDGYFYKSESGKHVGYSVRCLKN